MELKDFIKKLIRNYFIIFAIVVICITLLRQILSPHEYFELKDIYKYMICSLVADLLSLFFYSSKEITEKEMRLRILIHFVVLEAVLLTLANAMGWVNDSLSTIILAFQIAVISMIVRFLSWKDDSKVANRINGKLNEMKEELGDEPEE